MLWNYIIVQIDLVKFTTTCTCNTKIAKIAGLGEILSSKTFYVYSSRIVHKSQILALAKCAISQNRRKCTHN